MVTGLFKAGAVIKSTWRLAIAKMIAAECKKLTLAHPWYTQMCVMRANQVCMGLRRITAKENVPELIAQCVRRVYEWLIGAIKYQN